MYDYGDCAGLPWQAEEARWRRATHAGEMLTASRSSALRVEFILSHSVRPPYLLPPPLRKARVASACHPFGLALPCKGRRGAEGRQFSTLLLFGNRCRRQIRNRARIRTRGLCAKRSLGSGTGMLVVCRPSNAHDKLRCSGMPVRLLLRQLHHSNRQLKTNRTDNL